MENFHYLDETIIFLGATVIIISIARMLKISPILGYLLAGVIVGPHGLHLVPSNEFTHNLAKFGVVFLLFTIGLELPIQRLQILKRYVFGLGLMQVILTTGAISAIGYWLGYSLESSLLIGSALALSSTAVILQVLGEKGDLSSRYGRISFSVLLFQDLAVVILLMLISNLTAGSESLATSLGHAGLKAAITLSAIFIIGRWILSPIFKSISRLYHSDLFVAVTLLVILGTSFLTAQVGLSMELGAFLAGMLLSETEYRHQVEADILPFKGLLLGLFFATVGMTIDLEILFHHFPTVISLLGVLVVIKSAILFLVCLGFKVSFQSSVRTALLLAGGGEFAFVLLKPLGISGIVDEESLNILYAIVALSMACTPLFIMLGKKISTLYLEKESQATISAASEEISDLKKHIIIAGFGRMGHMMAHLCAERLIPFVVIDSKMSKVAEGRKLGYPVYYGDARKMDVFRTIGADKAAALVICIDDNTTVVKTSILAKKNFPNLEVHVRLDEPTFESKLQKAGVHVVVPDLLEPGVVLATSVFEGIGLPYDEVLHIMDQYRRFVRKEEEHAEVA